jgi:omega-6 fatty acid desaturase (delta-12 desaturase)
MVREGVKSTTSAWDAPWSDTIAKYKTPNLVKSWWQIVNSVVPFFGCWYLMYLSVFRSYWLVILLALPTAGFLVRMFIIQHDCGHHSFFRSRRANDGLGIFIGIFTCTPYYLWKRTHSRHHASSGDLSHRGNGDVGILTVNEYLGRSRSGRFRYHLYRNPLFLFVFGAMFLFMIHQRLTYGLPRSWRRERSSVHFTNLGILTVLILSWFTIGLPVFFLVHTPVAVFATAAGTWLFYIQHQYEEAYWQPHESWDFTSSAIEGSSFYRLPAVLQWFTGNIGYHHIHHLNSRIPNYNLPACHDEHPGFSQVVTLGLWDSFKCASLKLWDEREQRLVSFAEVHARQESTRSNRW